jgi:hypothetical protein
MGSFRRKIILVLAAGAGAALLLVGCGGVAVSQTPGQPQLSRSLGDRHTVTATEQEYSITSREPRSRLAHTPLR